MKQQAVQHALDVASAPPVQVAMGSTLVASLLGWLPVILAIPAALYYIVLIVEKIYGKKLHQLLGKRDCE